MDDSQTTMEFPPVPTNPEAKVTLTAKEYAQLMAANSNALTDWQLHELNKATPKAVIAQTELRGGKFDYIPHSYFTRRLNHIFRHRWTFEIVEIKIFEQWKHVMVHGRLKVMLGNGIVITKDQVGGANIKCYAKGDKAGNPMDVSDDVKAAASEAKKKCASELGIGEDVYGRVLDKLAMDMVELSEVELEELKPWDEKIDDAAKPEDLARIMQDLTKVELTRQQKKYLHNRLTAKGVAMQSENVVQTLIERMEACKVLADYVPVKREIEKVRDSLAPEAYRMLMDVAKETNKRLGGASSIVPERK